MLNDGKIEFFNKRIYLLLAFVLVVGWAACAVETQTTPENLAPTVDIEALKQDIVSTVVSEITQEAALSEAMQPTSTPTAVPEPTEVPTEVVEPTVAPTEVVVPTNTPQPAPTATTAVSNSATGCVYVARFVSQTVADGTSYDPDTTFTKTWQVMNNGSCSWDNDYKIFFSSGDQLDGPDSTSFNTGTVMPGETVTLTLKLKSPSEDGTYTGYWMLKTDMGEVFGIGTSAKALSVSIVVE